nr:hypothetical protein [Azospirillum sp. B510]
MQPVGQPALPRGRIEPIEILAHLPQLGFHPPLFSRLFLSIRPNRLSEGSDEGCHHVILHQPVTQSVHHQLLQHAPPDAALVGAGGRRQFGGVAGEIIATGVAERRFAAGADSEAGEQMLAAVLPRTHVADGAGCCAVPDVLQPLLDPVPQSLREDGQFRPGHAHPIGLVIEAGDALGIVRRVAAEALAVEHQQAYVERVAQDTARPLVMAADRGITPNAAAGTGNAAVVEVASDLLGAVAAGESGEDIADHRRLLLDDLPVPVDQCAVLGMDLDHPVPVGEAGDDLALADLVEDRAPGLEGDRLQVEGVGDAADGDVDVADLAFGQGDETNAPVLEPFEEGVALLRIAGQAVERLGENDVRPAGIDGAQHGLVTLPRLGRATDHCIGELTGHLPSLGSGEILAECQLGLDGGWVLLLIGVTGVDDHPVTDGAVGPAGSRLASHEGVSFPGQGGSGEGRGDDADRDDQADQGDQQQQPEVGDAAGGPQEAAGLGTGDQAHQVQQGLFDALEAVVHFQGRGFGGHGDGRFDFAEGYWHEELLQ